MSLYTQYFLKMIVESFSGIRGIYGNDLNIEIARKYANAFVKFLKLTKQKPTIVVGMDTRPSSEEIKKIFIEEFLLNGCDIFDVGINTTPAIELSVRKNKADGGIIITASHNEPEYNGWKFLNNNGSILEPEDADLVISNYRKEINTTKTEKGKIVDKTKQAIEDYVNFVLESVGEEWIKKIKIKKFKIVVDPNGGTAAVVIKQVMQKLGVILVEKNMKLGEFKRIIEPNKQSLAYLSSVVKKEKADLAAGWDCDGDRVELIDNEGEMMSGQYVLALLVEEILSQNKQKNSLVITNDATSGVVKETAEKNKAKIQEVEVGEINIVKKMQETNSPIGGEGSNGGIIIPPSKCRDGIQALALILRLMARKEKKLSEICGEFPKYYTMQENVRCDFGVDIIKLRKKIKNIFTEQGYETKTTGDNTGGLKIIIDDESWIWYRGSKTENGVYRIITDSKSERKSQELLDRGEEAFQKAVRTI